MIDIARLTTYLAAYPDTPPRTHTLEQRIQIGAGFHDKWYRSQKEHWLGWITYQKCSARQAGKAPAEIDARKVWSGLKCSPMMFWLAECAGVFVEVLDQAEFQALEAARLNPKDGNPHGKMIRTVLPWPVIEQAILSGPAPIEPKAATVMAEVAFRRLSTKLPDYRKYLDWLED